MCGISGFCFSDDTCINARVLSRALLEAIEERGREATGYAEFDRDSGSLNYNNAPVRASEFVKSRREFRLKADSRQVILHTRLATKGSINNPLNNHPVIAYTPEGQTVAAVHNGGVWNDDEAFQTYNVPRYAQVDSEIIPALIAHFPTNFYAEIFGELEGGIATGWLDERQPKRLNLVRAWDSPMVLAKIDTVDRLGSKVKGVIFASTVKALTAGIESIGLSWADSGVEQFEIGEGEFLSITDGEWDTMVYPFALPETFSRWSRKSNARSQGYSSSTDLSDEWEGYHWPYGTGTGWADEAQQSSGIGSGKVDSGKPSTYLANGDGSLTKIDNDTPMVLDPTLGSAGSSRDRDEYVSWWQTQDRVGLLVDIAERINDQGYVPTSAEMQLLATSSQGERAGLSISQAKWSRFGEDYMWHMECCTGGNCCWDDVDCPTILDSTDASAIARATDRWNLTR